MANLQVIDVGNIDGRAYIDSSDLKSLGIEEFDFIKIVNEYEDWAAVQVLSSDEVDRGKLAVDSGILDSANINDGDLVDIEMAAISSEGIRNITLGIEPLGGQTPEECILYVAENFDELTNVLKNRPMFAQMAVNWSDAGCGALKIRFLGSEPQLKVEEIGIVDPTGREVEINIAPFTEMSFNAVLVLDVSGSMEKQDMVVRNASGALEGLRKGLEETPELTKIIEGFIDGKKVSRINAAAFATMLFLSLKVAKGWGEQVQVLSFAENIDNFTMGGNGEAESVISCVGEAKKAGIDSIIDYVVSKCQAGSGLTFLSGAIDSAYKSVSGFSANPATGKRNPTMIVLLTDGSPNKGNGLGVNPIPVLRDLAMTHQDVVLYLIGLGEADYMMLKKLGEIGRGGAFQADDFGELWKYYDQLAQNFNMSVKTSAKDLSG